MRKTLVALAAVLAVLLPGTPAWAHAQLVSSDPVKDATLTKAPVTITLVFSDRLSPDFATIVVSGAARQRLPADPATVDAERSAVRLTQPLSNGPYTVAYRVVSVDGHTVQGSYVFTVADPALPPAAVPANSTGPAAASVPGSGGIATPVLIGLVALGILGVLIAAYFFVSGRRRVTTAPPAARRTSA